MTLIGFLVPACFGDAEPPVRVLFVGNSYTAMNDLPGMVRELAGPVGRNVVVEVRAPGGAWWRDHVASSETMDVIAGSDWDFVVLQEQSMAPADRDLSRRVSYPAAVDLAVSARGSGGDPVLFLTWAHRNGSSAVGHSSYSSMQVALAGTYQALAERLVADVAPVGMAWWMALDERPDIGLYQPDGSHPSLAGSYLAAAVITATLLDVDATSLDLPLGLDPDTAEALREFAARAVSGEVPWDG